MKHLTIIAGILSKGEFELSEHKVELADYEDTNYSLEVSINFSDCTEHFLFQVEGIPAELSEKEKDFIYNELKEAHRLFRNDSDLHYIEYDMCDEEAFNTFY